MSLDIGTLTGQVAIEDQVTDKITEMASKVKEFAERFEGIFAVAAIGTGAFVAAVGGAITSIVELGEKGSVINGVEDAFDKLAEKAGTTGDALREGLSEGVKSTIDEMTLMKTTSRLLSSGMKLTADDTVVMGEAARAMGKATGTDAAGGLSTLSSALLTGRTRSLAMAGIIVDLKGHEEAFAKSLGTTANQLNHEGKLEADRIAILDATKAYIDRLGVSELNFKERIQQGQVAIEEWTAKLEKSVASSPNVMHALDAVGKAITSAFGGDSQRVLDTIVGWVNSFADAVAKYGPPVIQAIADIWHGILDIWHTVKAAWDDVPEWFKNIAKDATLAGGSVYILAEAMKEVAGSDTLGMLANVAQIWSVIEKGVFKVLAPLGTLIAYVSSSGWEGFAYVIGEWAAGLTSLLNPITITIGAVAALYAGLKYFDLVTPIMNGVVAVFSELESIIVSAADNGFVHLAEAVASVSWDVIIDVAKAFWEVLKGITTGLIAGTTALVNFVANFGPGRAVMDAVVLTLGGLGTGLKAAWQEAERLAGHLANLLLLLGHGGDEIPQVASAADKLTYSLKPASGSLDLLAEMNKKAAAEQAKHNEYLKSGEAAAVKYAAAVKSIVDSLEGEGKKTKETIDALNQVIAVTDLDDAAKGRVVDTINDLIKKHIELSPKLVAYHNENAALGKDAITLAKLNENMAATMSRAWDEIVAKGQAGADKYNANAIAGIKKNLEAAASASDEAVRIEEERQLGTFEAQRRGLDRKTTADIAALDQTQAGYWEAVHNILLAEAAKLKAINQGEAAVDAALEDWDKKHTLGASLMEDVKRIPSMVADAFTGGGGLVGAAKGIGSMLSATLGEHLGKAITSLGTMGGPIGAAIGSLAGPLIEMLFKAFDHVGKDFKHLGTAWGVELSDGLVQQLKKDNQGIGGEVAAMLTNLSKIIGEAGGLNADNLTKFTGKLHDVFSLVESHQMTVAAGAKILDDNFDAFAKAGTDSLGLLDKKLRDIIALNEQFDTQSKAIAAYQSGQATAAGTGLASGLGISSAALKSYDELNKKQMDLRAQMSALAPGDPALKGLADDLKATYAELDKQGVLWDVTKVKSQEAASAIAESITGIIATNMQAGMSFIAAVKAAGPSVDALSAQLTATGFNGGAAFDFIKQEVGLANDAIAGPALTSIEGYTAGLVGLSNAGLLNQETFKGLAGQITGTEEALVAQGFSGKAVMTAMQGDLQTVWELQQTYGYSVDDTTQALIDQAVADGIVGEKHKSTTQQMLDASNRMVDVLEAMATFMGVKLPAAAEAGAKGVQAELDGIHTPDLAPPWDGWGKPPDYAAGTADAATDAGGGVVNAASGYNISPFKPSGTDTVPIMATPGERVLSVSQNEQYSKNRQDEMSNEDVVSAIESLQMDLNTKIPRAISRGVRDNLVGLRASA